MRRGNFWQGIELSPEFEILIATKTPEVVRYRELVEQTWNSMATGEYTVAEQRAATAPIMRDCILRILETKMRVPDTDVMCYAMYRAIFGPLEQRFQLSEFKPELAKVLDCYTPRELLNVDTACVLHHVTTAKALCIALRDLNVLKWEPSFDSASGAEVIATSGLLQTVCRKCKNSGHILQCLLVHKERRGYNKMYRGETD